MAKDIIRPIETRYWVDRRNKSPIAKGYPKSALGTMKGAGLMIMRGWATKVQCVDRKKEVVLWTAIRVDNGPGVPCGVKIEKGEV
jgi:hypothetical protein